MTDGPALALRPATAADAATVVALVRELATYERMPDAVRMTADDVRAAFAGGHAHAVLAERDGVAIGLALYFFNFSTWSGRRGLYLEDLFVRPDARGAGAGLALLRHLARLALAAGCARMEWAVLDWNEPALGFYRALGAEALDEWTLHRLDGDALARLAA